MKCPNNSSKFVQDLYNNNEVNEEQRRQILLQLESKEFETWFGYDKKAPSQKDKGYDTFGYPRLKDNLFIINTKGEKIKLYDLTNDNFYDKLQSFNELQKEIKTLIEVIDTNNIGLLKRIETYRGSLYVETLKQVLEDFNSIENNNYAKKLNLLSNYIVKTLKQFEVRLDKHDRVNISNLNKEQLSEYNKEHFNFLLEANDFINTFENITKLPKAEEFQGNLKSTINKFKNLESKVSNLKNTVKSGISEQWNNNLKNLSSNPQVVNGVIDFLSIQEDETSMQRYIDAMGDSNNIVLASFDKLFKQNKRNSEKEIKNKNKEWENFCEKNNLKTAKDFEKFLDENKDLIDEFDYTSFREEYNKFKQPLNDLINTGKKFKEDGKTFTNEYKIAFDNLVKWKHKNIRQPYVKEYYDVLDSLIPEAKEIYLDIQNKKQEILSKKNENITVEDNKILKDLDNQLKELKSSVYKDGTQKTGKDLEIANNLYNRSKELGKFFETESINFEGFEKAKKKAEKEGKLEEFLKDNTSEQWSESFQKSFSTLMEKFPKYKELEEVKNRINQLLINYKDFNGVNTEILPKNILEKYKELQLEKIKINAEIKKVKVNESLITEYKNLVNFIPSKYYLETKTKKEEDLKNGIITKDEYNTWYFENHEYDEYLEQEVPTSLNTVMRPVNKADIITAPTNKWKITKIKAEYYNTKGDEAYWKLNDKNVYEPHLNNDGYSFPVNRWKSQKFKNLSTSEQDQLNYIKNFLYDLIKHTNGKKTVNGKTYNINDTLIGKGGLPAVPLTETENTKQPKTNEKVISESGEIVKILPLHYLKKLGEQLELPKITKEMSEKEIEDTKKEIERIKEQNKQNHINSLNTNLFETMKYFINTAVTNKNKSEMLPMIKATLNQFKDMQIKSKNAKGETIFDRTKSAFKGEQIEHTINGLESNAYKHFKDWVEAVYYEEFNYDEGKLTEITQKLLTVSSFVNIGFNVLGGVNNKIVASLQLKIEAAGGQYFNARELTNATKRMYAGSINFIKDTESNKASSLDSGFIKYFDILKSQDELGDLPSGKVATDLLKKGIKLGYLPQHLGEFHAQNTLLLAMIQSNRIIDNKIVSYFDYAKKYDVSADVKKMRAEGKTSEEILNYINDKKVDEKIIRKEFEKYEKLEDQFELIDGELNLKKSSQLSDTQINDFREKVIATNQKLHGIYNIEDAAMLQRYALGRLGLQFRKWLGSSWNRRFGAQFGKTVWNERRQEYDEGMYVTFGKFIASPFAQSFADYKKEQQKTALGALKVVFKGFSSFINNAKINWQSLSMYEKANIKRVGMEMLLIVGALTLGYILKNLGDDDEEKNIFHTWVLNQTNRLYGELTTFNFGILNEGNRLVSNPFAVFKTLDNVKKLTFEVVKYPFVEDEELIFKSGTYHGRNKASVYLIKNLPIAKNIQDLMYMQDNLERYSNFYGH